MVLSILLALAAAPGILGTQEAVREGQRKEKREEYRARRCNLIVNCVKSSKRSREINGKQIVLKDSKLYIDTSSSDDDAFGHPFTGYYLPYPDAEYEGLVTTITDEAPILNWVYVDKDTYEVKYGVRLDAQPNLTGPFDWTKQDRRLTLEGWEGFVAVEESPSSWRIYFDKDDDGLRSKIIPGVRVLEIELSRKEKRYEKTAEETQSHPATSQPEKSQMFTFVHRSRRAAADDSAKDEDDDVSRCNTQGSTVGDDNLTSDLPANDTPASSIQSDDETEMMTDFTYEPSAFRISTSPASKPFEPATMNGQNPSREFTASRPSLSHTDVAKDTQNASVVSPTTRDFNGNDAPRIFPFSRTIVPEQASSIRYQRPSVADATNEAHD